MVETAKMTAHVRRSKSTVEENGAMPEIPSSPPVTVEKMYASLNSTAAKAMVDSAK